MQTPTSEQWEEHLIDESAKPEALVPHLLEMPENKYLTPLIRPGVRILDAGSGNGRFVFAFAQAGADVVGLDFSERLTKMLQENARKLNLNNITAVSGDMLALPFADRSFNLYTSFGVYEHFLAPDHKRLFAEAHRVLKPGGLIYLEVPQFWSAWTVRRQFRYWYRKLRPPSMVWQRNMRRNYVIRKAEVAGFQTVESHVFDAWYGLQKGFSLDQSKLIGLPNPFYWVRPAFRTVADACERREWLGHTLVYIGRRTAA